MFKIGNFEAEIAKAMAENLSNDTIKKQASMSKMARTLKITKAVEQLNAAATALDQLGFHREAEAVTVILEKMAGKHPHSNEDEYNKITMMSLRKDHPEAYEALPYSVIGSPDAAAQIIDILEDKATNNLVMKTTLGEFYWDGSEWNHSSGHEFLRGIDPTKQSLEPVHRKIPLIDKDEEEDLGEQIIEMRNIASTVLKKKV